jgi:hypothetical protein
MINKEKFYKSFKQTPQMDFLLDGLGTDERITRLSWVAYALATIEHETAGTFKPVVEGYWIKTNRIQKLYNYYRSNNPGALRSIFPNGTTGKTYEGRGYVQLTHEWNYAKFGLKETPDKALEADTALKVLIEGMTKGSFTGKKLSDYLNDSKLDFYSARKIINGLDRATLVAGYAVKYYNALEWAETPVRAEAENGIDVITDDVPGKV